MNESVDSFEHVPKNKLTKADDGDSSIDTLERILGPVPLQDQPPPDVVHMDARMVQNSTHAHNVQNRVESPLPSHEEICDNAVEMLARVEKHEKEGRERSLANMDTETQGFRNQVQSLKASRQALDKQKEASRLATPVKRGPIIPKTPASSIRRVSREISSMTTPSQMQRSSSIPTPGSSSVRDVLRSPLVKAQTKMMFKEYADRSDKQLDKMKENINMNAEKQHKNTQIVINRNVRNEHAKTRRENRLEMNQMEDRIMSKLAEQHAEQSRRLDEYIHGT